MNIKLLSLAFIASIAFETSTYCFERDKSAGTRPPAVQSSSTTRSKGGRIFRPDRYMDVAAPSVPVLQTDSNPTSNPIDAFTNNSASSSARATTGRTTTALSGLRRGNHAFPPVKIDPNFELGTFYEMQGPMYVCDVFNKLTPARSFYYGDVKTNKYRSYLADDGVEYTIQDVVGDGRCGDYTLSIDREDLVAKTKKAITENDRWVALYSANLKEHAQPDLIKDLEMNWLDANTLEKNLHAEELTDKNGISCNMHLAAYLYGLNIEIYVPNPNYFVFDKSLQENTINRIELRLKATFKPGAPVIRLIHRGEHEGKHFRYLYNKDNLQLGEEFKIRKLEYALRQKIAGLSYEDTHGEICSSQQKVYSGEADSINPDSSGDDTIIELIATAIGQGADYISLKEMGYSDDQIKAAKARKQTY